MAATLEGKLDHQKFGSVLVTNVWLLLAPFLVGAFCLQELAWSEAAQRATLFGLPLVAVGIAPVGIVGIGPFAVGLVTVGGVGVVSFGGVGLVSFGGVALGVIALGGAACGLIAVGGGALGYVAVGGGACGVYVLAGGGKGRHVLDRTRQDPEAVAFFRKFVPGLSTALAG